MGSFGLQMFLFVIDWMTLFELEHMEPFPLSCSRKLFLHFTLSTPMSMCVYV